MPISPVILEYIDNITVGFKNTKAVSKKEKDQEKERENKLQNNEDWLCTEGIFDQDTITCKIPNIPHFDHENPFFMLDVSLNGQEFTELPHTFRYYFITETKITPNQGEDDTEP